MMMHNNGRKTFPFSARQWEELEQQALVYKYMACGMPIPPDLIFTIRTSLHSSLSSKFLLQQPHQHMGWASGFDVGFGRKIDPEPGRCRRTDGKKWRCSKEAYPDSKYCERHMHRGRNRSRKPVEIISPKHNSTRTNNNISAAEFHFINYPKFSSHQENNTKCLLESSTVHAFTSHSPSKDYRDGDCGMKGGMSGYEHGFNFSEGSSQMKDKSYSSFGCESFTRQHQNHNSYFNFDNIERDDNDSDQPNKVMHHFLDEWAPNDHKHSEDHTFSAHTSTQLSISMPNALHDFFITQKW